MILGPSMLSQSQTSLSLSGTWFPARRSVSDALHCGRIGGRGAGHTMIGPSRHF